MSQRIHYFDNLRAIATIILLPYHTSRLFDWPDYYIKAAQLDIFEILCRFIDVWFMPLFFLIAGASARFSLQKRKNSQFVLERLRRLMVSCIIGCLLLMPINGYIAYLSHGHNGVGFLEYLPFFFSLGDLDLAGFGGGFAIGHLWFLIYLTLFSLLLATFEFFKLQRLLSKGAKLTHLDISFLLLAIFPIFLGAARSSSIPYPNPIYFLLFYGFGFIWPSTNLSTAVSFRLGYIFLSSGMLTMLSFLFLRLTQTQSGVVWYESLRSVNAFLWTLGILILGKIFLDKPNHILHWLNKHGLTIYIIHLPIISFVGYTVLNFHFMKENLFLCWVIIMLLSSALTLTLANLLDNAVKSINLRLSRIV